MNQYKRHYWGALKCRDQHSQDTLRRNENSKISCGPISHVVASHHLLLSEHLLHFFATLSRKVSSAFYGFLAPLQFWLIGGSGSHRADSCLTRGWCIPVVFACPAPFSPGNGGARLYLWLQSWRVTQASPLALSPENLMIS